ncbi:hypothetical protein GGF32_008641, partial [Allomyces javanicus]
MSNHPNAERALVTPFHAPQHPNAEPARTRPVHPVDAETDSIVTQLRAAIAPIHHYEPDAQA